MTETDMTALTDALSDLLEDSDTLATGLDALHVASTTEAASHFVPQHFTALLSLLADYASTLVGDVRTLVEWVPDALTGTREAGDPAAPDDPSDAERA